MPAFTQTSDWLLDYYSNYSGMYISGHESLSRRFGIDSSDKISLLYAANKSKIFAYILTIVAPAERHRIIKDIIGKSQTAKNIIDSFATLLNSSINIILYDPNDGGSFSVANHDNDFTDMNEEELLEYFSKIDKEFTEEPGADKDINKSINDRFQIWRRINLSKYIVFNDFDILIPKKGIIMELKRVQENIENWEPYLDDSTNYAANRFICNTNNIKLRVIAYNSNNTKLVAYHEISKIEKTAIYGRYLLCKPNSKIIADGISTGNSVVNYRSTRTRCARRT